MSLFGSSPNDSVSTQRGLFGDDAGLLPAAESGSSLFAVDSPGPAAGRPPPFGFDGAFANSRPVTPVQASGASLFAGDDAQGRAPWGMPTPKKAPTADQITYLLAGAEVPDSYVDAFEVFGSAGSPEYGPPGVVQLGGMSRVMNAAKLGEDEQDKVLELMLPTNGIVSRDQFYVFMALVGLAQEGEELSLDAVDQRRINLPQPHLPGLFPTPQGLPDTAELAAKPPQRPDTPPTESTSTSGAGFRRRTVSEDDPWGSPETYKHIAPESAPRSSVHEPRTNGHYTPVQQSTPDFITRPSMDSTHGSIRQVRPAASNVWYSYGGHAAESSYYNGAEDAFGGGAEGQHQGENAPARAIGGGNVTRNAAPQENILVTLLPEKEGIFMFQHHNYQVSNPRTGSKVVRRFSDFVWLLDCLHKRYPFRRLPLLPPKRVGVNGSHLAADTLFMERRRRGLVRFVNALVRHPVLKQEQLVVMFLTVPTELAVWRKQATVSVQDEFAGRQLTPELEDSLPPTLDDLFETTRSGLRKSAEIYINLCSLMDRLAKRSEGLAADHGRISFSLMSLTDASHATYATDTNDVPLLNEGLLATAKHASNSQSLLVDEARAWDEGVLEDLKFQRDALVSMREMFERRDRYDRDNIPALEKRIRSSEAKLAALRQKPENLVKPGEVEKVIESMFKDRESIVAQHARSVFVKQCVRDELAYFQATQYHVSRWNQDWAQERVKYAELQADNWRQLHDQVESMPLGE